LKLAELLIEIYKQLLKASEIARSLDEAVFRDVEEACIRVGDAITRMRTRGKLDPSLEREFLSAIGHGISYEKRS